MSPRLGTETAAPDEAAVVAQFVEFLKEASLRQHTSGPVRRFNQGRATACVRARFTVPDGLATDLRVGLFARPASYDAWIRFANASSPSDRDRDIRGMSIKVSGVAGENLTPGSTEQDFVLNSHPVMLAPDTPGFLELLRANEAGGLRRIFYFASHGRAAVIGRAAQQHHTCHLDIPYWSAVPFRFGADGTAVKYAVRPTSPRRSARPKVLTDRYLTDNLRAHLAAADATFDLFVQFQKDAERMPIEDATVEWKEAESPYRKVAEIHVPSQAVDEAETGPRCETTAFNPWHCLAEHRPLGGMNRARRDIYDAMAAFRAAHASR